VNRISFAPQYKFRFSELAKVPGVDKTLFSGLTVARLDNRKLLQEVSAFGKVADFYVKEAGSYYHSQQSSSEIITHLRARLDNTKDGSPAFEVGLDGKRVGLAFMLQYSPAGGPVSWQSVTSDGLFLNDDPKLGEILACPQLIVSAELLGSAEHQHVAVCLKLMDEMMEYARDRLPKPSRAFQVWVPQEDGAQNQFHLQAQASLERIEYGNGLIPYYHHGPMMKVYDYTDLVRHLLQEKGRWPAEKGGAGERLEHVEDMTGCSALKSGEITISTEKLQERMPGASGAERMTYLESLIIGVVESHFGGRAQQTMAFGKRPELILSKPGHIEVVVLEGSELDLEMTARFSDVSACFENDLRAALWGLDGEGK
jgi:hypothetical protein